MKPLFFPFTYLRQQDIAIMLTCFKTFSFFSTSSKNELYHDNPDLFNISGIDPVFMEDNELKQVLETLNEYKKWAMLNHGNLDSLKTFFRTTPYFTSDTGVESIRSAIGKGSADKSFPEQNHMDNQDQIFLKSLLFLRLAHENDAENEAIDLKLQSVATEETNLFLQVKGEMENKIPHQPIVKNKYDPGLFMTEKRLNAWTHVLIKKNRCCDGKNPLLLVTTSRGIADYFDSAMDNTENSADTAKLIDIENFKIHGKNCRFNTIWQIDLNKTLINAMTGKKIAKNLLNEANDKCTSYADIKLYKLSANDITRLFHFLKTEKDSEMSIIKNKLVSKFYKNFFVCFINIKNSNRPAGSFNFKK